MRGIRGRATAVLMILVQAVMLAPPRIYGEAIEIPNKIGILESAGAVIAASEGGIVTLGRA